MLDAIDIGLVLWLAIGTMAGIGEMVSGTMYLLPFTIGAIVAAVLVAVGVDMVWSLAVFALISLASLVLLRRLANASGHDTNIVRAGGSRYTDAIGVVTSDISQAVAGRVRIETESWRALTVSTHIATGTEVRVVEVRGNAVVVVPSAGDETQSTDESDDPPVHLGEHS
ncbi:MAG: NfeD family protein [bacterium]|nr:NfeD family protein [bacterium]MCP4968880.1 NfeD family protein [bacterium]